MKRKRQSLIKNNDENFLETFIVLRPTKKRKLTRQYNNANSNNNNESDDNKNLIVVKKDNGMQLKRIKDTYTGQGFFYYSYFCNRFAFFNVTLCFSQFAVL